MDIEPEGKWRGKKLTAAEAERLADTEPPEILACPERMDVFVEARESGRLFASGGFGVPKNLLSKTVR